MRRLAKAIGVTLVSPLAVEGSLRLWLDTRPADPPLAILAAFETCEAARHGNGPSRPSATPRATT